MIVCMNKLSVETRARILQMMIEGVSIRSITRMVGDKSGTNVSKNTVAKFLAEAGEALANYQDEHIKNVSCKKLQCDEIWSFVYAKDKNAPEAMKLAGTAGDAWTWTAIDADTKLVISWLVGSRDLEAATTFMLDVESRLANKRVQITADGWRPYILAVDAAFGKEVDFAQLKKHYAIVETERKYSPSRFIKTTKKIISGNPDMAAVSTSFAERQNLSMRMGMRRFTRLTNGFSKKFDNHVHAIAIYFMHYNFGRVHKTLRVTPAQEAGLTSSPMSFEEMVAIIDAAAPPPKKRGPYKIKKT